MDIRKIYEDANALLSGHFLLSSGKHSDHYLQSAKVLESPAVAESLAHALAEQISKSGVKIDAICSPALGGILAGYELARALKTRFIFAERVNGQMTIRRGFEVRKNEKFLICEDIITTGGSALEAANCVEALGGVVVAFAGLANRGICKRWGADFENIESASADSKSKVSKTSANPDAKLPANLPLFALADFVFNMYSADACPLCAAGSVAIKPGSRGN